MLDKSLKKIKKREYPYRILMLFYGFGTSPSNAPPVILPVLASIS